MTGLVHVVASRGRPDLLKRTVKETIDHCTRDDTRIVVVLDKDDDTTEGAEKWFDDDRIIISLSQRENTLGAKYNRGARACHGGIAYCNGVDDLAFKTQGWDQKVVDALSAHDDGYRIVMFGKASYESTLPACIAVSANFIKANGEWMPELWPFWFHDTWWFEVAQFLPARSVTVEGINAVHYEGAPKTTRLRDVCFWAALFDMTRKARLETAEKALADIEMNETGKVTITESWTRTWGGLHEHNANLRDYLQGYALEKTVGEGLEPDAGYLAAKKAGELVFSEKFDEMQSQRKPR